MKQFLLICTFVLAISFNAWATVPAELAPSLDIEVVVYPNPNNGTFFLNIGSQKAEVYQVKVVNLIGQSVWSETLTANAKREIDLSAAPKGVYFVQIEFGNEKVVKRVVLQ